VPEGKGDPARATGEKKRSDRQEKRGSGGTAKTIGCTKSYVGKGKTIGTVWRGSRVDLLSDNSGLIRQRDRGNSGKGQKKKGRRKPEKLQAPPGGKKGKLESPTIGLKGTEGGRNFRFQNKKIGKTNRRECPGRQRPHPVEKKNVKKNKEAASSGPKTRGKEDGFRKQNKDS